jgi:phosphoglycerol transferase MdoB-like AlkP superfamily enzyme
MPGELGHESAGKTGIRVSHKVILYVLIWMGALIATDPSLKTWALIWMFPLGLAAFVNLKLGNDGGWWAIGGVTAIYLIHAIFYFRSKTTRSTIGLLAILVVLLVCNVAGCHTQQEVH